MTITPESVQQLIDSENFGDRIKGMNQLRQLPPNIAFTMIQPMVTDKNTRVRYAAVSQLDTLGHQDLQLSLELLRDRLFNDSEVDVQAAAADAIAGLKLTEAFDDLKQVYEQTSEWLIEFSIVAALGELGDPRGFDLLINAIKSENSLVKTVAISALGELGDPRGVSYLLPLVNDDDWQVRYRLTQALGNLGGTEAKSAIEKLSQDSSEQIAQAAKDILKTLP